MTKPSRKKAAQQSFEGKRGMKIGEVSRLSGIGVEALRFYERNGLIGRPGRTRSGYRLYDDQVLERLDFIKRAQTLGFSLEEISQIIAEREAGRSPCAEVRETVQARLQELEERMKQMKQFRRELVATLDEWKTKGDLDGNLCGLIETSDLSQSKVVKQNKALSSTKGGQ
jgi:MerR family transcriptional regulator, copper efflux regulator